MVRRIVALGLLALAGGLVSLSQAGPLGVGVVLGEPTGLTAKQWLGRGHAVDAAAAWSFADATALHFQMDYLFHRPSPPEIEVPGLLFYFGVGGRIKLIDEDEGRGKRDDGDRIGVRFPLGLDYLFAKSHLEVFMEIAPILDLAPESDFEINGGVGLRYYFGGRPRSRRI
ncbi:MAG: DUF3996 domain-containing protein [bacterium]